MSQEEVRTFYTKKKAQLVAIRNRVGTRLSIIDLQDGTKWITLPGEDDSFIMKTDGKLDKVQKGSPIAMQLQNIKDSVTIPSERVDPAEEEQLMQMLSMIPGIDTSEHEAQTQIKVYSGSGFDARTFEYFEFIGRPLRNIQPMLSPEGFEYEIWLKEKQKWVKIQSPDEPEFMGVVSDLNDQPSELMENDPRVKDTMEFLTKKEPVKELERTPESDAESLKEFTEMMKEYGLSDRFKPSDDAHGFQYPVTPKKPEFKSYKTAAQYMQLDADQDLVAKVEQEVNDMRDQGISEIDLRHSTLSKYGDAVYRAIFKKTGE